MLAVAVRRKGSPHIAEDWDLAIADRYGVDPWTVRSVWPRELVDRALQRMEIEGKHRPKTPQP